MFYINIFHSYYALLIGFWLVCLLIACVLVLLPYFLAPKAPLFEKLSAYECGFEPFSDSRGAFDVHFIIVAILFLLFDFELLLLFPFAHGYANGLYEYGPVIVFNLYMFLFLLILAFAYEWKSKALLWPIFLK